MIRAYQGNSDTFFYFQRPWIICDSVLVLLFVISMHFSQYHALISTILDPRSPCRYCQRFIPFPLGYTHSFQALLTPSSTRVTSSCDDRWPHVPLPHRHIHLSIIRLSTMVVSLLGIVDALVHLSELIAGTHIIQSITERYLPTLSPPFLERVSFHLDL
jgi:hypothetical protein